MIATIITERDFWHGENIIEENSDVLLQRELTNREDTRRGKKVDRQMKKEQ